jgi:hypothetical protein
MGRVQATGGGKEQLTRSRKLRHRAGVIDRYRARIADNMGISKQSGIYEFSRR